MLITTNRTIPQETRTYLKDFENKLTAHISKIQQHQEYSHLNCEKSCTLAEAPDDKLPYKNSYNDCVGLSRSQAVRKIIEDFFEKQKSSL